MKINPSGSANFLADFAPALKQGRGFWVRTNLKISVMEIPKKVDEEAKEIIEDSKNMSKEKMEEVQEFTKIEFCPKCDAPMSRSFKGWFCSLCGHK
jgi:hypothetical protein